MVPTSILELFAGGFPPRNDYQDMQNQPIVINATPHDIAIPTALLAEPVVVQRGGVMSPRLGMTDTDKQSPLYIIPPSGWRLPARAVTDDSELLSVLVSYRPSDVMLEEMQEIRTALYSAGQGVRWFVIASEISCRAVAPELLDDGVETIELRYPVLAHESLWLPPDRRWCSALARPDHVPAPGPIVTIG